jgi:glucokinase
VSVAGAVLALDIGGTKLASAIVNRAGEVLAERSAATDAAASAEETVEALFELCEEVLPAARASWQGLEAAGISFGGPVDFPAGRTVTCHHLRGWENFPLRDDVGERAGLPTALDNDANAAALGEARFGAGRGCAHLLYITVSTGIGAGLVLNGSLHRGANSMAGELGHTLVAPNGPACTCGRRGCLEAVAAGPAIAARARQALEAGAESALAAVPDSELTAKHVAELASADPLARQIMTEVGERLGVAVAAAVNLVNPDIVVIGGGVSQAGDILLDPTREAVRRHAVPESVRGLRIVRGELGARDALLGAAALAIDLTAARGEP